MKIFFLIAFVFASKSLSGTPLTQMLNNPKSTTAEILPLITAKNAIEKDEHGHSPLYYALKQARTQVVSKLLANGADANEVSKCGQKPLDIARIIKTLSCVTHHSPRCTRAQSMEGELLAKGAKA